MNKDESPEEFLARFLAENPGAVSEIDQMEATSRDDLRTILATFMTIMDALAEESMGLLAECHYRLANFLHNLPNAQSSALVYQLTEMLFSEVELRYGGWKHAREHMEKGEQIFAYLMEDDTETA